MVHAVTYRVHCTGNFVADDARNLGRVLARKDVGKVYVAGFYANPDLAPGWVLGIRAAAVSPGHHDRR